MTSPTQCEIFQMSQNVRDALDEIRILARLEDVGEALGRAIGDELFLRRKIARGWRPVLMKGTKLREIMWPD